MSSLLIFEQTCLRLEHFRSMEMALSLPHVLVIAGSISKIGTMRACGHRLAAAAIQAAMMEVPQCRRLLESGGEMRRLLIRHT